MMRKTHNGAGTLWREYFGIRMGHLRWSRPLNRNGAEPLERAPPYYRRRWPAPARQFWSGIYPGQHTASQHRAQTAGGDKAVAHIFSPSAMLDETIGKSATILRHVRPEWATEGTVHGLPQGCGRGSSARSTNRGKRAEASLFARRLANESANPLISPGFLRFEELL